MTLRVTLEIVPLGIEQNKRTIGTIEISNLASKTKAGKTRYRVKCWGQLKAPWHDPTEWQFLHMRDDGALVCLELALRAGRKLFQGLG